MFKLQPPLWARGYLARSIGQVRISGVRTYLDQQAAHHGYDRRLIRHVALDGDDLGALASELVGEALEAVEATSAEGHAGSRAGQDPGEYRSASESGNCPGT